MWSRSGCGYTAERSEGSARSLLRAAECLSLKVIPTTGPPQSLRRPAPHPILAPRSPGPPPASSRGAVPAVGSAAAPEQIVRLPFGKDYIPWRKDTVHKTDPRTLWRPMGKRGGGKTRPRNLGVLSSQTPGRLVHLLPPTWNAVLLTLGPGHPSCPGLFGRCPDLWVLG